MSQKLIFTHDPATALNEAVEEMAPFSRIFLLADSNTARHCLPLIASAPSLEHAELITIDAGDENKSLDTLASVWQALSSNGATRSSLFINLGGGMVTDLGGFAASTFKRGIRFINIPTTLLGAVDAAVGGKTGINFSGLKNEIGAFSMAGCVILSAAFYSTLPHTELLSGYGEVLKHSLLDSQASLGKALSVDLGSATTEQLGAILEQSVMVKQRIVKEDPFEHGIRKALNLGHTAAHAFESLAMERHRPLPHGIAVAHGLIVDLVLSHMRLKFPSSLLQEVATFVKSNYPAPSFDCKDYSKLIQFMRHDKKNASAENINFTLLKNPGEISINRTVPQSGIETALDITRDLLGV